mmetsp:Transcript_24771/g.38597  ORF Transcript_24771/g.38597 Transcript_24771/m.38597 type:complete len:145 (-) Transcript_24771:30-464(-)
MIHFILLVNKQGQTRMSQYYHNKIYDGKKRSVMEADIIRKCLSRGVGLCSFMTYNNIKVIYKQYASLFFVVGVDESENELAILEFIHAFVLILDQYFENVCEIDIMFNLEKVHYLLEETVTNGTIVDVNQMNVLRPLKLMENFE